MKEKIGIGIITYNREHLLKKLLESLKYRNDCEIIIVNDGTPYDNLEGYNWYLHNNETNLGVGKSKNIAFKYLLEQGCDHLFLIEDDIFIKDDTVFEKYVKASKETGIQHFNFALHGLANIRPDGSHDPNPKLIVNYGNSVSIVMYQHCVGAFSYYSRKCLETAGLMDERYYNACEHVDHTYEIIKKGMHPPFWYFADIADSSCYIGDEPWSIIKSSILSNPLAHKFITDADKIFVEKHGHLPQQTELESEQVVFKQLKNIQKQWT